MAQLLEGLDTLEKRFADDCEALRSIKREIEFTNEWIIEHTPEEPKRRPRKQLGKVGALDDPPKSERSIFDDIDADEGDA